MNLSSNKEENKSESQISQDGKSRDSKAKKETKKRGYQSVSDIDRVKLVILITEHKYTCFAAAKKLAIPYTNAKVIFRTFRIEGRVIQKDRFFRPNKKLCEVTGKMVLISA